MAISFNAAGTSDLTGSSSVTLSWPIGYAVGDLLLAVYGTGGTGQAITSGTPSGWTQLFKQDSDFSGLAVYYKIAASTSEATFAVTAGGFWLVGQSFAYSGVDPTTPIDGTPSTTNNAGVFGSSLATASVTTTNPDDWIISLWCDVGQVGSVSVTAVTAPGVTQRTSSPAGGYVEVYLGDELQAAAGASTVRTMTETGGAANSIMSLAFALKAAPTITLVNSYTPTNSFGTTTTQTISAPTAGNTLLIMAAAGNAPAVFTSVTNNLGATATVDFVGSNGSVHYCRFSNVSAGITSITLTTSAADALVLWVFEISGLANAAPEYAATLLANTPNYGTSFNFTVVPPHAGSFVLGSTIDFGYGSLLAAITPYTIPTSPVGGIGPFYGMVETAGSQTQAITTDVASGGPNLDFVAYAIASAATGLSVFYLMA